LNAGFYCPGRQRVPDRSLPFTSSAVGGNFGSCASSRTHTYGTNPDVFDRAATERWTVGTVQAPTCMVHERHGVVGSQHAAGAVCLDVRQELLLRRRTSGSASAIAPGVALGLFGSYRKRAAQSKSHSWVATPTSTRSAEGAGVLPATAVHRSHLGIDQEAIKGSDD